jgi:hypothetical protein
VTITVSARRLALVFASLVGLFVTIHTGLQLVRFATGDHRLMGLLAITSLGSDVAVPSFYSAVAILVCCVLLGIIALGEFRRGGYRPMQWAGLSAIFLFLSIDEMVSIHERIPSVPVFEGGVFYYAWVGPYAVGVVLFALAYSRFFIGLPRQTAWLFVLSGSLFLTGALGFEIIGGFIAVENGTMNVPYVLAQSIEEILEMLGIVVFIYALASYAQQRFGTIGVRLTANVSENDVFAADDRICVIPPRPLEERIETPAHSNPITTSASTPVANDRV